MPCSGRGAFGASRQLSPKTTACTTEAVRPLAQAVTVGVTVTVIALCVGHHHHFCAACGVGVRVIVLCGCRSRHLCAMWVSPSWLLCHVWCCGCCAMCGVTVVVPCMVSQPWLLHRVGVAVAVFALHVVSQLRSLHHVWVAVAVFAPHVVLQSGSLRHVAVTIAIVAPHGHCRCCLCTTWLSRSQSSCHMVLWSWWLSSCHMVLQLWSSLLRHHWTIKEEVSRKKKKENLQAGRRGQ